jgi:hypothetical protein
MNEETLKSFYRFTKNIFRSIKRLFTDHPNSMDESYLCHGSWAMIYSAYLLFAGIACFIHAIFPFLFTDTASSIARWVIESLEYRKRS